MASRNGWLGRSRWLSFVAVGLLATTGTPGLPRASGALARLEGVRSDQVDYRLAIFFEGLARPTVILGQARFKGPGHWRVSQKWLGGEAGACTLYVSVADVWNVEELVGLSVHPLVHLRVLANSRWSGRSRASEAFSFTLNRMGHCDSMGEASDEVSTVLESSAICCRGTGTIAFGARGRAESVRLQFQGPAPRPGRIRQTLQVRLLEFGEDHRDQTVLDDWLPWVAVSERS